ncbi:glycogen synthase GlgA [Enterococcus timonensis]|uniref:glycogen synthase GlgA n=1 Tax=Enterococcus timonensis TaxID=1852364 RepID=UPI0008DB0635|nr:glycogen synthase GlgA [Enterococcus timonensis]
MKILFAAAEAAPFFKTGGLGDVAYALPKELARQGHEVAVILPYFSKMPERFKEVIADDFYDFVQVGWRRQYVGVKKLKQEGVLYYFLDNEFYFGRHELYGYYDDGERWAFFSLAVLALMKQLAFKPDVLHVNDFHTAMMPFLLKEKFGGDPYYDSIKTILTIHNIEFQGAMDPNVLPDLFGVGMERFYDGTVRMGSAVNFLKAGIFYADLVNTVSPTYAKEIQTPAFGWGLDGILRLVDFKLSGILNGIDYTVNNPETDPKLPEHFSSKNLAGKARLKAALQKKVGLPVDKQVPLIGIVSRLTLQKGFDLVLQNLPILLAQDVQLVVLGTGMPELEHGFSYYAEKYPEKFKLNLAFDVRFAQEIYAGADLFLMPSAFEPCGLSQMIAMRYGTLPIVHAVGGLKDTVKGFHPHQENTGATGFSFEVFNEEGLNYALNVATNLVWNDPASIVTLQKNAMAQDFSWESKAALYIDLYQQLLHN